MKEYLVSVEAKPKDTKEKEEIVENTEIQTDKQYFELKQLVKKAIPYRYATWRTWIKIMVLLITSCCLECYCHYNQNYHIGTIFMLGLMYAWIGLNVQHDANHGTLGKSGFINRIFGLT